MSKRSSTIPMNRFPPSIAPVGTVTATCCPTMAGFQHYWGVGGGVTAAAPNLIGGTVDAVTSCPTTFGFDNRTNIPNAADRGTKEYWTRPGAPGTSGGRRDLDGSSWVCVGVGATADVEIKFVGQAGNACIANVSIAVDDPSKATVTPTAFAAQSAKLSITGVAEGECTITVSCNGQPIGWCHASVYNPGTVSVSVWRANLQDAAGANLTSAAAITAADIASIQSDLNNVYGQCAVSWTVINRGTITYTTPGSVTVYNASLANGTFPAAYPTLFADFATAGIPTPAPSLNLYYFEPLSFTAPTTGYGSSGGVANGIPSRDCMIFAPIGGAWDRTLLPHELGHNLGLFHPNDSSSSPGQLPDNFRLPMLTTGTGGNSDNVMYSDHINVMGYGSGAAPNAALRYGQWKTVQSII